MKLTAIGQPLVLLGVLALAPAAHAVGTAAGTDIENTATATFDEGGTPKTVNSNKRTLRVDELLDVTIVQNDAGNVSVAPGDTNRVLSFTVTNTGNGPEQYAFLPNGGVAGDDFDPSNVRVYIDNGDNIFDPLTDTLYVGSGVPTVPGNEPMLAADTSVTIFVVSDIPGTAGNGDVGLIDIAAEALTAQATDIIDAPGFVFAATGPGGTDSVVGSTTAYAMEQNGYLVSQILTSFNKTSQVIDQFGGSNPVPGATIRYTLTFTVTGSGDITNLLIVDPIPANTVYTPGTIVVDGVPKTDIVDGDNVIFNATVSPRRVEVDIGTATAPATHTVTFDVEIQ